MEAEDTQPGASVRLSTWHLNSELHHSYHYHPTCPVLTSTSVNFEIVLTALSPSPAPPGPLGIASLSVIVD